MFVPSDLIGLICNYIPQVKLHSWINPDKIIWWCLSTNPNAIPLLEKNQDKINWNILYLNPSIFEIKFDQKLYSLLNKILL